MTDELRKQLIENAKTKEWRFGDKVLSYKERPLVMGILNVTMDSFSDGGNFFSPEQALARAIEMEKDGADIIDIGAESTRPGAEAISADEELSRLIPALKLISQHVSVPISVDTYKAKTAREALSFGASIINDVWGLMYDPEMAKVVAEKNAGLVLMANYTRPDIFARKGTILESCEAYFEQGLQRALDAGIAIPNIVFDPGIGFGTETDESIEFVRSVPYFQDKGYPMLIGASRKRFIGATLGGVPVEDRDAATIAVSCFCAKEHAVCVRVHDARGSAQALTMWKAMEG
ncbi:MAG: dihydropteroate synthase [Clostridiales bacterium]|nr:dihydropteroate synthase [Clostridiales bacterium]